MRNAECGKTYQTLFVPESRLKVLIVSFDEHSVNSELMLISVAYSFLMQNKYMNMFIAHIYSYENNSIKNCQTSLKQNIPYQIILKIVTELKYRQP